MNTRSLPDLSVKYPSFLLFTVSSSIKFKNASFISSFFNLAKGDFDLISCNRFLCTSFNGAEVPLPELPDKGTFAVLGSSLVTATNLPCTER